MEQFFSYGKKHAAIFFIGACILITLSIALYGVSLQTLVVFIASYILFAIAIIDIETMEIPDQLNLALLVLAVISLFVFPEVNFIARFIGIFTVSVPMLLMNLIVNDSFGGGDIKLCAASGFLLGWQQVLAAGFIGLMLGGIFGSILLLIRKKGRKDYFAFGPFLSLGIGMALFMGKGCLLFF